MKPIKLFLPVLLAGIALNPVLPLAAAAPLQDTKPGPAAPPGAPPTWTTEQIITSSVREAWALGGKTPEGFFEIVRALTEISAQKRGVTIPESPQAGAKAGEWIKKQAKKDPDQLLYVIVDQAVQHSAGQTTATK